MLLRRLEDEMHRAVEPPFMTQGNQRLGRAEQHRRMAVMAAGMHLSGMGRTVRKGVEFIERQRVHVGAQPDGAAARADLQRADDAGAGEPAMHDKAKFVELSGHQLGGAPFAESELGMRVKVAADRRDALLQIRKQVFELHRLSPSTAWEWPSYPKGAALSDGRGDTGIRSHLRGSGFPPRATGRRLFRWRRSLGGSRRREADAGRIEAAVDQGGENRHGLGQAA